MSIKEIAKRAGVSPATVSRVLNHPEYRCSDSAKRERIWKAAMELNYVPNDAARQLRQGNRGTGVQTYYIHVLMTRAERNHTDPFYTEVLRVVESEIHRNACILSNVWYMSLFSDERQCQRINLEKTVSDLWKETEQKSDGLIVIGKCAKTALELLKKYFKNVVSINRNRTQRQVDEVTCDGEKIAALAVDYLVELGHTEIGYVGPCHGESRYKGFCDTLLHHGIEPNIGFVWESRQTEEAGFEIMSKILQTTDFPTGIYCAHDIIAIGMLKALKKTKNRFFSISVISSDDIEQAQFTSPMLTTIALPKNDMGRFAVYLLLDRISGRHDAIATLELEGCLKVRESCVLAEDSQWCDYYI